MTASTLTPQQKWDTRNMRLGFLCVAIAEFFCAFGVRLTWKSSVPEHTDVGESMRVVMIALTAYKLLSAVTNLTILFFPKKKLCSLAFGVTCIGNAALLLLCLLSCIVAIGMAVLLLPALIMQDFHEGVSDFGTYLFCNAELLLFPCIIGFLARKLWKVK